jgi:hypothetical protein
MVIHDLYFVRISVTPFKADAPLVINSYAVLAGAIPGKFFQAVSWWCSQIVQGGSRI